MRTAAMRSTRPNSAGVAPGGGGTFLPRLFALAQKNGLPFWSYFCVGMDGTLGASRHPWLIPGSRVPPHNYGFFGPETPWTDLLCARVDEFLRLYPFDWLLFDWFFYGAAQEFHVQPCWFVAKPFAEIIGRPMPEKAEDITPEESVRYQREVLARQFCRLRDTVKRASPQTKIMFNVPFCAAAPPLWVDHPMLRESDGLFAESDNAAVVEWLLSVRRPGQRVMTTIIGWWTDPELKTVGAWRKWYDAGC